MTIVYGQIESLKRIKNTLKQKGIRRFNSIGEINDFIKNYEYEQQNIYDQVENDLNREIEDLQTDRIKYQENFDKLKAEYKNKLNIRITSLKSKCDLIKSKHQKNRISKVFNFLQILIINYKIDYLVKYFEVIIRNNTLSAERIGNELTNKINICTRNKGQIILERSLPEITKLEYIRDVIEAIKPTIAGAIGENLVEKELKKLSDKNILFNDFSMYFNPPIYNRKENDKIFSIQIDHLLLTPSGIFILETKNWSKNTIENCYLRSPIEQIMRTGYALFVILNGDTNQYGFHMKRHHWGNNQIPIRNIVVMINQKPKEKFKYVQVKTLNELNSYINFFDPIFNDSEMDSICDYLKSIMS